MASRRRNLLRHLVDGDNTPAVVLLARAGAAHVPDGTSCCTRWASGGNAADPRVHVVLGSRTAMTPTAWRRQAVP